jgi:hypothetical protein
MPYNYNDTSVINGNMHTLTLSKTNNHTITLSKPDEHTLTLATPIVVDGETADYNQLVNKPRINNVILQGNISLETLGIDLSGYWQKSELIPMTAEDIDIITGFASSVRSFTSIFQTKNEVVLDSNLTFMEPFVINKTFTIDLNGQVINSIINGCLFDVNGGVLTIKGSGSIDALGLVARAVNGGKIIIDGGSYNTNDIGFTVTGVGSKIVFNKGELTATKGGIGAYEGAEVVINDGTLTVSNSPVLFTNRTVGKGNNTITVNGGTLSGNITSTGYQACGIYIANDDAFLMNGGTVNGIGGCGLLMRGGTVVINGGKIYATTGANVPGYVVDTVSQMTASAVIFHESANYPGSSGMSLTITEGLFIGVDHSIDILSEAISPNVTVTGGNFLPEYPEE